MKRFTILILLALLLSGPALKVRAAAAVRDQPPTGDAIDQGLWWLYQLQYEHARQLFDQYTTAHPNDPAGYFYKMGADWWQLAQEMDKPLPEVVDRLYKDFDDTVSRANVILSSSADPKALAKASLYAGGAEGLKGRYQVTVGQWVHAYFSGKRGNHLLKKAVLYDPELYDAYLGLGIYDYYTDTLPGVQKVLAAIVIRGDRVRGLKEIGWAIEKGERSSVEASMFLIEIYTYHENTPEKGLAIATEMHRLYPKSPAMYLAEIIDYYELKRWDEVTTHAQEFLDWSEKDVPYYRKPGVFPGRYCLGVAALYGKHDADHCFTYMESILKDSPDTSRWRTFAFLRTGQVYDVQGKREKALEYYRKVLSRPNCWGAHQEAKNYIKEPFKF